MPDTPIDHRAEAKRLLAIDPNDVPGDELPNLLRAAQVHATLAAGTPVVDQHVSEALADGRQAFDALAQKHVALHEAVRAYIAAPTESDVPDNAGDWYERLRELVR